MIFTQSEINYMKMSLQESLILHDIQFSDMDIDFLIFHGAMERVETFLEMLQFLLHDIIFEEVKHRDDYDYDEMLYLHSFSIFNQFHQLLMSYNNNFRIDLEMDLLPIDFSYAKYLSFVLNKNKKIKIA